MHATLAYEVLIHGPILKRGTKKWNSRYMALIRPVPGASKHLNPVGPMYYFKNAKQFMAQTVVLAQSQFLVVRSPETLVRDLAYLRKVQVHMNPTGLPWVCFFFKPTAEVGALVIKVSLPRPWPRRTRRRSGTWRLAAALA